MFRRKPVCTVTGKHKFDAATHQCGCGQWERGYKPQKAAVLPRAECQICEREQAVEGGVMVNHGYRRPGWGFIVGNCMGCGFAPFPATDALEQYAAAVERHGAKLLAKLAELPTITEVEYSYEVRRWAQKEVVTVTIKRGDEGYLTDNMRRRIPSFTERVKVVQAATEAELSHTKAEAVRVAKRIEKAKAVNA